MIAIRVALEVLLEVLGGFGNVEFGPRLLAQWKHCHVKSSVQGPFFPCFPVISLDSVFGPVPSILTLDDIHDAIDF